MNFTESIDIVNILTKMPMISALLFLLGGLKNIIWKHVSSTEDLVYRDIPFDSLCITIQHCATSQEHHSLALINSSVTECNEQWLPWLCTQELSVTSLNMGYGSTGDTVSTPNRLVTSPAQRLTQKLSGVSALLLQAGLYQLASLVIGECLC